MYLIVESGIIEGVPVSFKAGWIEFKSDSGQEYNAHCSQMHKTKFSAEKSRFKQEYYQRIGYCQINFN